MGEDEDEVDGMDISIDSDADAREQCIRCRIDKAPFYIKSE